MIHMIMHGCNGAMGQVITQMVCQMEEISIVAGIDPNPEQKQDYPVFACWEDCTVSADVVVDFASTKAVENLLRYCKSSGTPLVLCTTGLSEQQLDLVEEASKDVAILRSANMSLGINTLLKLVQDAARILAGSGFDIEIVEKHHNRKVDAPSGTALALADSINQGMGQVYHYEYDRSTRREKRDPKEIGIHAVRGGTIVGEHDVVFAGQDEVITISHTAYSRAIFAKGAVEAAGFLAGKEPGLYNMSHVIASSGER